MSRMKDSDGKNVETFFPSDFENVNRMLRVKKGVGVELFSQEDFVVHPEYDSIYKMYSMYLARSKRIKISDLYPKKKMKKSNEPIGKRYNENILNINHKEHVWIDYIFQIPGIENILGFKRAYRIENINEVFQEPLLFLFLVKYKFSYLQELKFAFPLFYQELMKMVDQAFDSLEKKEKNNFSDVQLIVCKRILIDTEVSIEKKQSTIGTWQYEHDELRYRKIEKKLRNYVIEDRYIVEVVQSTKTYPKGERICIPEYSRSIFVGMAKYSNYNPFVKYVNLDSIWKNDKVLDLPNVDIDLKEKFSSVFKYLIYKGQIEEIHNTEKWDSVFAKDFVKDYYIFCIGTYFGIINENSEYKQISRDTFEKIYSLFLFSEEAKIIQSISEEVVEQILPTMVSKDNREKLVVKIAQNIMDCILPETLHAIYISPGMYHRVELGKYILKNILKVEDLVEEYKYFDEKRNFKKKPSVQIDYWDGKCDYKSITQINDEYSVAEMNYIKSTLYLNKKEFSGLQIQKEYANLSWINNDCVSFYQRIDKVIEEERHKTDDTMLQYGLPLAKKVTQRILDECKFVYQQIFLGVILYSFFSSNDTWIEIED